MLGSLWIIESNFQRLKKLAEETARVLSHFRPGPDLLEVTRTALALCAIYTFLIEGPRAVRSLVALQRLPPAPPDTMIRAAAVVLGAAPEDRSALYALCDSDEPLVAGAADGVVSYFFENVGDLDSALKAARRHWKRSSSGASVPAGGRHARISELCLQVERGEEARRHLLAALPVMERLGNWSALVGIRWWLVLASLQVGDVDEAEHWLEQTAPPQADEPIGTLTYGLGVRAEILLARGEVEAGLRLWRRAVDLLAHAEGPIFGVARIPARTRGPWRPRPSPWWPTPSMAGATWSESSGELPRRLATLLTSRVANPPPYLMELPLCGGLLLALAMVDLDRGARTGDHGPPGRGRGWSPWPSASGSCGTSSRPCPPPGPARRPSRPTGRRTRTRCRRTPAWVRRSCGPPPWWRCGSASSTDGGLPGGLGSRLYSFLAQR